jgi:hypothetical protein
VAIAGGRHGDLARLRAVVIIIVIFGFRRE